MSSFDAKPARILILEPDAKVRSTLLRQTVKGFAGAAVQSTSGALSDLVVDSARLKNFDVLLVACDFSNDGTTDNATLRALRAVTADPNHPAVILLTTKGSEYTAVHSIKAGAFDYIPKELLGREQLLGAIQRAILKHRGNRSGHAVNVTGVLRLFGYDIRRCLATRDSISVHVAFSAERGAEVVLKVLQRSSGSLTHDTGFAQLMTEFKLLNDINDHAVAEIYDFRVTAQYSYIAMEYFAFGHLGTEIDRSSTPERALHYGREIAHDLSIIHAAGIVHRDLKPSNIMLRGDGTVALIDFGIARATHGSESKPTSQQEISGTPYYMSPEQARGEPTDERTDLYALGVILHQLLTGEKPYIGTTTEEILEQHKSAPLPVLPGTLALYQPLLNRLLAKDAAQRFRSAREVEETLERLLEELAESRAATAAPPALVG